MQHLQQQLQQHPHPQAATQWKPPNVTIADNELITAQELELHAVQQQVSEMIIVETDQGYELHAPCGHSFPT